jgi:hypothetical protein
MFALSQNVMHRIIRSSDQQIIRSAHHKIGAACKNIMLLATYHIVVHIARFAYVHLRFFVFD